MATTAAALLLLPTAAAASAAEDEIVGCASSATVSWEADHDDLTLEAASVHVPGCSDDDVVGFLVVTDGGDRPTEPLVGEVVAERATFDLTAYDVGIAPTTGVRVFLYGDSDDDTDVLPEVIEVPVSNGPSGDAGDAPTQVAGQVDTRDPSSDRLPFTGGHLGLFMALGAVLLVAGGTALGVTRDRLPAMLAPLVRRIRR